MSKSPKFKVGDAVKHPKTLYDETEGTVVKIDRIFQETYADGTFNMDGLADIESTIHSCVLPYRFDGKTYEVDFPAETIKCTDGTFHRNAYTKVSKFFGYAYTVETPKMRTLFSERSLRKM